MLACELDPMKYQVEVYERNAAPGRKFLVAGDGGLNLTHSEPGPAFLSRYSPPDFLREAISHFPNTHLIRWLETLGIRTYTGSSGRVFPEPGLKPVEVLNRILEKARDNQAGFHTRHVLQDISPGQGLVFQTGGEERLVKSDLVIFCLGGASWPVTGSDGAWTSLFTRQQIEVLPFMPSNCTFHIHWPAGLADRIEGKALKNLALSCGGHTHHGEVVLTRQGIEGSGVYPLSPFIRRELQQSGEASLLLDFKPSIREEVLAGRIRGPRPKGSFSQHLRTVLHLHDTHMLLLKHLLPKDSFLDPVSLARHIKSFPLTITGTGPLEDAISTVGGIALSEIDSNFQLRKLPGHYAIGEMLNYDAPTGGYLLQSCFSMAKYLADHLNS